MKRKAVDSKTNHGKLKKHSCKVLAEEDHERCFRQDLFTEEVLERYVKEYSSSEPYKHGVITSLINDELLRAVRAEIRDNIQFTPKETDIYKIHQSGDLANLDGLEDKALEKLPSLLQLRNALYSKRFRKYIAMITGCKKLSGQKTDMAINVYTPGCHLLCHDDVIGSRMVSYILYLTDPDVPWKDDWGGALRLFSTTKNYDDGVETVTPCPDPQKVLPPAWNQLSFFAVQPGQSFHDVEEVYHAESIKQLKNDGGRIRMAISGWYHIPQKGEEGYVEGEEERWGINSSLKQLQGNPDRYDFPKPQFRKVETLIEEGNDEDLSEDDLDFLLKYIDPNYLIPDTLVSIFQQFTDSSYVTLDGLLSRKFSERLKRYIEAQDQQSVPLSNYESDFKVARPPHKHRYLYTQPELPSLLGISREKAENPFNELITSLFPSKQFRRWIELATMCTIESFDIIGRRFRRGLDYSLATCYEGKPRLEISLGLTPTLGWTGDDVEQARQEDDLDNANSKTSELSRKSKSTKKSSKKKEPKELIPLEVIDVGGHEIYMAGDEDETEDATIYKHNFEAEDENILFTIPASWNKMSIVLRDRGVLKFMKYVSKKAQGDRWDISCTYNVKEEEDDGDSCESENENSLSGKTEESDEEEFNGFSDSEEKETD